MSRLIIRLHTCVYDRNIHRFKFIEMTDGFDPRVFFANKLKTPGIKTS